MNNDERSSAIELLTHFFSSAINELREEEPPAEFEITFDPRFIETLGPERIRRIHESLLMVARQNLQWSNHLGMSGAMRWPTGMRPEVHIITEVRIG